MNTRTDADQLDGAAFRMIDATIQHAGDHWVVVPNDPGPNVLVINATGREVLRMCDGATPFHGICQHIAATFDTTTTAVRDDIAAFLDEVTTAGIVKPEP